MLKPNREIPRPYIFNMDQTGMNYSISLILKDYWAANRCLQPFLQEFHFMKNNGSVHNFKSAKVTSSKRRDVDYSGEITNSFKLNRWQGSQPQGQQIMLKRYTAILNEWMLWSLSSCNLVAAQKLFNYSKEKILKKWSNSLDQKWFCWQRFSL